MDGNERAGDVFIPSSNYLCIYAHFPFSLFLSVFVLVRCSVAVFPFIFFHDFLNVSFSECNYVICTPLW